MGGGGGLKTVEVHARMREHCSMPCALLGWCEGILPKQNFTFGFSEIASGATKVGGGGGQPNADFWVARAPSAPLFSPSLITLIM